MNKENSNLKMTAEQMLSIMDYTRHSTMVKMNYLSSRNNPYLYITADGTKLMSQQAADPKPHYFKPDGTVILNSDIIADYYHLEKIADIETIYNKFSQAKELLESKQQLQAEREHQKQDDIESKIDEEIGKMKTELLKHLQNKQVHPIKERIELNDKATKQLFNYTDTLYEDFLNLCINGHARGIIEKRNDKKFGKIVSPYQIFNKEGYNNIIPLNETDRAILSVCISYWLKDNKYITYAMILRGLTGKVTRTSGGKDSGKIEKNQFEMIDSSLRKLMFTEFIIGVEESFKQLNYSDGKFSIARSAILPACIVRATINGQQINAVYMDRLSPLLQLADAKNQILRYPVEWLDIPNQNNTPLVITLKNYCVRRVKECIDHKMTPTLTIDDIFAKCRINDASSKTKNDARKTIDKIFAHLQSLGVITSYQWRKSGNKIDAITFTYNKKSEKKLN